MQVGTEEEYTETPETAKAPLEALELFPGERSFLNSMADERGLAELWRAREEIKVFAITHSTQPQRETREPALCDEKQCRFPCSR